MIENTDVPALVRAIRALARESRAHKRALRRTWTEPMAEVQRAHRALRHRLTDLLILRAWLRGKHHLRAPLREGAFPGMTWDAARYHAAVAARVASEFAMEAAS